MDIAIRRVETTGDRESAYEIRRRVFQDEQRVPAELEFDEDDEVAVHVVAEADGVAVGTGRVVVHGDYAKIGRMAVLAGWRRHEVGRRILEALMQEARRGGIRRAVLHAQVQAIGFYERSGFVVVGDEFGEAGIPHRRMEREL